VVGAARHDRVANGGLDRFGYEPGSALNDLERRIDSLERVTARRERVFNQLMDLFAAMGARR
jgi:general secretion pathway protein A